MLPGPEATAILQAREDAIVTGNDPATPGTTHSRERPPADSRAGTRGPGGPRPRLLTFAALTACPARTARVVLPTPASLATADAATARTSRLAFLFSAGFRGPGHSKTGRLTWRNDVLALYESRSNPMFPEPLLAKR